MAVRTATRGKLKATKIETPEPMAALDVIVGAGDGAARFQRVDVAISRASNGGLHVEVGVPDKLTPAVGQLLAALGVACKGRS